MFATQPKKSDPSPEEKKGKELTFATDIWDFGCLIEAAFDILDMIPEPEEKAIIKKMKAKKAKDRPSMEQLKTMIEQL